ncbi:pilus assembly protein PilZ [Methylobacterium sp. Leaf123]|uniref:PilZ domain-containing protein n=1 Tax=Methylobacterium sp. Leaf123 TaxID=1736264 RepID=UPI0006FBC981|nr:PilZ domain-containing protein [Methylobacterium sp. Leaf123]KQQ18008.1 pilus assembly protein PilZ [Methylobacterium sp. Leaf123]
MISEKRQEPRKRTFLKGRIHFNKGASSMDCLVRDFSEMGARLELSETSTLPDTFDLFIPQKEITLRSNLRWRRGDAVGVAFAEVQKPAAEPAPSVDPSLAVLLRRIAELEAENAGLRAVIASMGSSMGAGSTNGTRHA